MENKENVWGQILRIALTCPLMRFYLFSHPNNFWYHSLLTSRRTDGLADSDHGVEVAVTLLTTTFTVQKIISFLWYGMYVTLCVLL